MNEAVQSLSSWFSILGWARSPIFGPCHYLDSDDEFIKNYLSSEKLLRLEADIMQSLDDGNRSNIRFIGDPGSGKTSFLYYLKRKYKLQKNDYVLYVFHANRADDNDNYRELTQDQIVKAWECLYKKTDNLHEFKRIDEQNIPTKQKLNILADYYLENKIKFDKYLIFVVDDVDLLSDQMALNITKSVKKDIELASVIKLVSIRPCTFKNYSSETKKFIEEFYPTTYTLPHISLHEIIKYRIASVSNGCGKNPYSIKLCDDILQVLFSGNKRECLSSLKSILETSLPKKLKLEESEKFIQQYIERSSINSLIDNNIVPNIHDLHFRSVSQYPLPHDILQLCCHTKDVNIMLGALNEVALIRSRRSERLTEIKRKYQVRSNELDYSLNAMEQSNLIIIDNKKFVSLTGAGRTLSYYAARDHYQSRCKENIPISEQDRKYWEHLGKVINYGEIVETYVTWRDRYNT